MPASQAGRRGFDPRLPLHQSLSPRTYQMEKTCTQIQRAIFIPFVMYNCLILMPEPDAIRPLNRESSPAHGDAGPWYLPAAATVALLKSAGTRAPSFTSR